VTRVLESLNQEGVHHRFLIFEPIDAAVGSSGAHGHDLSLLSLLQNSPRRFFFFFFFLVKKKKERVIAFGAFRQR
jgi:hypothetical protein